MDTTLHGMLFFVLIILKYQDGEATTPATLLYDQLFTTYNSGVRPYCNGNSATPVRIDLALRQVLRLDEPTQIITMNLWVRLFWTDCQLTWTPSSHGNITSLVVPFNSVWVPDLTLYDSASDDFPGYDDYKAAIYSDGSVYYNFPTVIQSHCLLNVEKFPFDSQKCSLTFGSWRYNGDEVDLVYKNPYGDLTSSVVNVEWNISAFTAERHVLHYGCCPEPYPDVTYYIHLKRKPAFYIVNIIVPTFLLTGMAMLGFFLPSESGEKVSLQITVLLALALFQLLVADSLPPSADTTPLIAIYFTFCLFLVGFACLMTVVGLTVHYQPTEVMHRYVYKTFLKILARVTFVYVPPIDADQNKEDIVTDEDNTDPDNVRSNATKEDTNEIGVDTNQIDVLPTANDNTTNISAKGHAKVDRYIGITPSHWEAMSKVLDRLSCVVFVVTFLVGTGLVFSQFTDE